MKLPSYPTPVSSILAACLLACSTISNTAQEWHPGKAPLMTRWAKEVSATNALPEYPRPQLVRAEWQNLNGLWDYGIQRNTVPDVSDEKNDANVNGAPAFTPAGGPNGISAYFLDGEKDCFLVRRPVADDFTISLWVKTMQTGAEGSWVAGIGLLDGECPGVTDDFGTAIVGNSFAFGVGNPDTTIQSKTPINDGQWHHLAAVRTRATGVMQVFVDGRLEATGTGSTRALTRPTQLTLGGSAAGGHRLKGSLADVRVFAKALTETDISALSHAAGKPAAAAGLVGWWKLDSDWQKPAEIRYEGQILVPFPIESALSGVRKQFLPGDHLWYRRTFAVPEKWKAQRVLLHFDAVDYEASVWLNGKELGRHRGGYDHFTYDITDAPRPGAVQELKVSVVDPTDSGNQAHGKQVLHPGGAAYTASSGIWQTVWLEPVAASAIAELKLMPDVDASVLRLKVRTQDASEAGQIEAIALAGGKKVASAKGKPGEVITLPIPTGRLWSPDDPFLYDLKITRTLGRKTTDEVRSYFGLRKIAVTPDAKGVPRLMLNNRFVFERGPLDQGFWPDGLYTPPTDGAIKFDLEYCKAVGFNLVRKHLKIEPERWYYWADKLGLLVWQDMPSGNLRGEEARRQWETEMTRHLEDHFNHPSIVTWVLFNEGWGQYDTARLVARMRSLDSTRLINDASGWYDQQWGDIVDKHFYPGPGVPRLEEKRASVTGEFGGLGYVVPGHVWRNDAWGYMSFTDSAPLTELYQRLWLRAYWLAENHGLSAAVYTQISDVEQEANGLMTYDREVEKIDRAKARACASGQMPLRNYHSILPTSRAEPQAWSYTATRPAADWAKLGFDVSTWRTGKGGFGSRYGMDQNVHTVWEGADLWIRQEFTVPPSGLHWPLLEIYYGADTDIYINGVRACEPEGFHNCYGLYELNIPARAAIKPGTNVIAVHLIQRQKGGEQFVDIGLLDEE
jgi:hypothetical protein